MKYFDKISFYLSALKEIKTKWVSHHDITQNIVSSKETYQEQMHTWKCLTWTHTPKVGSIIKSLVTWCFGHWKVENIHSVTAAVRVDNQGQRHSCFYWVSVEPSGARNTGDWHNTYFLSGCSVPDGWLEAACFISVLPRHRQVAARRRDEMTLPPSATLETQQPLHGLRKKVLLM